jgi:hypothetical protein
MTLGGAWPIHVRITLRDGKTHDAKLCGGVSVAAACSEDAHLELGSVLGGYLDITEGSSPLPSIEPSAEDAAEPLVVDSLSIPIDRLGEQEKVVGEGSLPNGFWTTGTAEFPDPWPEDLALRDATVKLELRSLESGGKPFENAFVHGWRPGVERVRAILVFDVLWFKPGATLKMRNLRVD